MTQRGSGSSSRPSESGQGIENPLSGSTDKLRSQLVRFQNHQFTGRIDVTIAPHHTWSLYLALGRLAWASGGPHAMRRWRRQLLCHQLTQTAKQIKVRQNDQFECWDYQILTLLATRQLANTDTVMQIIHGVVTEVLFDISQAFQLALLGNAVEASPHPTNPTSNLLDFTPRLGVRPSTADTAILPRSWTIEIDTALDIAQTDWDQWTKAGLALCSPNLAPVIKQHGHLQSSTSPKVYQQLSDLINSKRTLRDVAVLLKRDVVGITKSLLPYIRKHYMGLTEIQDISGPAPQPLPESESSLRTRSQSGQPASPSKGLVVCIDDSPQIGHALQDLLQDAGYEVVWIQEAVQALPTLLQKKPNFVLLDLMMPIANGYEICSQIRRVDQFKELPVVILTSNDGLVDRVRAKVVGATDFLSKPINAPKVLGMLSKYGLG